MAAIRAGTLMSRVRRVAQRWRPGLRAAMARAMLKPTAAWATQAACDRTVLEFGDGLLDDRVLSVLLVGFDQRQGAVGDEAWCR